MRWTKTAATLLALALLAVASLSLTACASPFSRRPPVVVFLRDRAPGFYTQDQYGIVMDREHGQEEREAVHLVVRGRW